MKTGAEEGRLVLPDRIDYSHKPVIRPYGNDFLLLWTPGSQKSVLALVKGNPLSLDPTPFKGLELETYGHLQISPDARYLACYGWRHHAIFEQKSGVWGAHRWEDDPHHEDGLGMGFLSTMTFTPDSRFLVSSSRNFSVVYDLAAGKQVKKWDSSNASVLFTPDGSAMMAIGHSGMDRYDTRDWVKNPAPENQHGQPVREIQFLDDGKTLLSHDEEGFIVWDVPSRKPRAVLSDPQRVGRVHQFALANGQKEIIAGNGHEFLRWPLPDLKKPVPPKPEVIVAKRAFQELESASEPSNMALFGNETGNRFITLTRDKVELRDLSAPGRVKTFTLPKSSYSPSDFHAAFLSDTQAVLYPGGKTLYHLNLVSGESTLVPLQSGAGSLGPWLSDKRAFLTHTSHAVTLMEGETGVQIPLLVGSGRTLDFQNILNAGFGVALTRDRKLAATSKHIGNGMRYLVQLWDLPSRKMLAEQELKQLGVDDLAFSPDGKTLAIGHRNTAISLWDVTKMLSGGAPPAKTPEVPSGPPAPRKKAKVVSIMELPKQPLKDREGHAWSFHPDGSCSVESLLPGFASLKVNGKPFQSSMVRYKKVENNENFRSPTSIVHDGGIEGGEIAISRYLGYNSMRGDTSVQAIDSLTNLTGVSKDLEISFEVRFPADSQGLLGSLSGRLPISAEGFFSLQPKEHWIAAADSGKKGEALACVRVNTWSNPQIPKLSWSAESQTVKLGYRVSLLPGETRWMVHSVVLKERPEEGFPDKLAFPHVTDVGHYVMPGNQAQGINFSRPQPRDAMSWNEENGDTFAPDRSKEYQAETDALGFTWERQPDLGRAGGLGATSLYQIWFDQRPSAMSSNFYFLYPHQGEALVSPPVITRYERSLEVGVVRQDSKDESSGATVWYDRYFNHTDTVKTLRVSYVTTFKSPVKEVWDSTGKKHAAADFKGPATAATGTAALSWRAKTSQRRSWPFTKTARRWFPRSVGWESRQWCWTIFSTYRRRARSACCSVPVSVRWRPLAARLGPWPIFKILRFRLRLRPGLMGMSIQLPIANCR